MRRGARIKKGHYSGLGRVFTLEAWGFRNLRLRGDAVASERHGWAGKPSVSVWGFVAFGVVYDLCLGVWFSLGFRADGRHSAMDSLPFRRRCLVDLLVKVFTCGCEVRE